jgi:sarcosine oxidase subunit delta
MRIECPFCGDRGSEEFAYLGDAKPRRPDPAALEPEAAREAFYDYVYLRDNPNGIFREYWYHSSGCHQWLVVTRDLRTHAIAGVELAS